MDVPGFTALAKPTSPATLERSLENPSSEQGSGASNRVLSTISATVTDHVLRVPVRPVWVGLPGFGLVPAVRRVSAAQRVGQGGHRAVGRQHRYPPGQAGGRGAPGPPMRSRPGTVAAHTVSGVCAPGTSRVSLRTWTL